MILTALAALVLIPVVYAIGLRLPSGVAAWRPFLVMSFLNNIIPFLLIVRGQKEIASGLASVLNATTPLFSVVLAHVFTTDEKLNAQRLMGVLAGISGVAVLVGPEALFGNKTSLLGMLLVRSVDRAERVRRAMLCRGFRGVFLSLHEFRLAGRSLALAAAAAAAVVASAWLELAG